MSERKPCPFCGSNSLGYQTSTEDREGYPTNILCEDCGCAGPWLYLKKSELPKESFEEIDGEYVQTLPQKALDLWNKRK